MQSDAMTLVKFLSMLLLHILAVACTDEVFRRSERTRSVRKVFELGEGGRGAQTAYIVRHVSLILEPHPPWHAS